MPKDTDDCETMTEFMLVVIGWICGFLTGWYYGDKGNA